MVIVSKFIIILHYKFVVVTSIPSVIIEVAVVGGIRRSNSGLGYFFLLILRCLFLVDYENKGRGAGNRVKNLRLSFPNLRRFFFELL